MKTFKEFLTEQYSVEVEIRDAAKANDFANDAYRGKYRNDGSNVFVFKKKSDMEDFIDELSDIGIEALTESK